MPALPVPLARWPGLLALLLGAAAGTGFAPLDWWPVLLAAFAGWMALVHAAPSWRAAAWRGWLFGVGQFSVNDNWIQHAFDFQQQMPPALGYAAPVLLALYLAVYPAAAALIAWSARAERPDGAYVLAFAAAWVATEWLRATLFTGYAWDPLGVSWLPLIGIARMAAWVGTYALSGLSIAAAGALWLAMRGQWRGPAALAVALAVLATVNGLRINVTRPNEPNYRVRVVQPDIGQDQRGDTDGELMLRALARLSGRPGPVPRLIVWPEGVVRDYLEDGYPDYIYEGMPPGVARWQLASLLGPHDLLLAGGTGLQFDRDANPVTASNSIYAVSPDARLVGRYDKAHLVPYGEYLPMRPLLTALGLSRLVPGDLDFIAGPGPRTLALPGFGAVGMQLCYEIVFSGRVVDEAHRPALLFNPSNDAWFGRWGPPQHLAQARMRAIEEGLPILRATPTGISAVIAADGRVLASLPLGARGAIETLVPVAAPPTLFSRLGLWTVPIAVALLSLAAVALRRRAR